MKTLESDPTGRALPRHSRRVLIITSSGGGAHLSAAVALEERLRVDGSVEAIHTIDLLQDWAGLPGRFGVGLWNRAMRHGDSRRMNRAVALQRLGDVVLQGGVRRRLRETIRRLRINEILDCQVMSTRTVLEVARRADVSVTKVLTEPAHAALNQYRGPIRRLPNSLRQRLRLWGSPPLLEKGESEEHFWSRRWGLHPSRVDTTSGFPVRAAFSNGRHDASRPLRVRVPGNGGGGYWVGIPASARLITVVMGSQGTQRFTRDTVMRILESHDDPALWLVAYVPDRLLRTELLHRARALGSRTRLVPLAHIDPATLAELYRRSGATVTRSGGMTSMELLSTSRAPALIYSRGHRCAAYAGMVEHEHGNFRYVRRFHEPGAWVVDESDLTDRLVSVMRNVRSASLAHP